MKVQIVKHEGTKPYVFIFANETVYKTETIEEWIRQLRIAKKWLEGK
jgi:hypothetical protein